MNTKAAEAVLVDNRIPARVVAAGPFWIDLAVLDDWEERIYSVSAPQTSPTWSSTGVRLAGNTACAGSIVRAAA